MKIENFYRKFEMLLDNFVDSDKIERIDKEKILIEFKSMIDDKIRKLHNEDDLM